MPGFVDGVFDDERREHANVFLDSKVAEVSERLPKVQ